MGAGRSIQDSTDADDLLFTSLSLAWDNGQNHQWDNRLCILDHGDHGSNIVVSACRIQCTTCRVSNSLCGVHGAFTGFSASGSGFFAAPVLIVLAFSGLYFNQPDWTLPVVKRVMTVSKNDKVTNYPVSKEAAMLTVAEAMQSAQDRYPTARLSRIVLPKKTAIRMRFVRGNPPRFKKMMAQRGSRSTHIADRSCRYVILYGVPLEMCF